ncbi:MAG: RagB/SusD family nutrient uptake outer membrane protein [Prevotellaceae bacterium]|jgi:hypothetical protein|nr:RagB/SusD family nutrient uptake outer membrane protein [Prevotellaceae bacterium]
MNAELKYKLLTLALPLFGLAGCSDFLERSAQDLIIPQTALHYKELLQGEGYFAEMSGYTYDNYLFVMLMTDDVEYVNVLTDEADIPPYWLQETSGKTLEFSNVETYASCYRWDADIEATEQVEDKAYYGLYRQAMVANICLEGAETCEGTREQKQSLKGQAAFSRAFAYFMLANLYAKPYASALHGKTDPNELCVPIKPNSTPTLETFSRATIGQVWGQIASDIDTALANLKDKTILNRYEIRYPAALVLAMRIALYMEDWDKVIACGEEFVGLGMYPLQDISTRTTSGPKQTPENEDPVLKFINTDNSEVAWCFGHTSSDIYSFMLLPYTSINTYVKYLRTSSLGEGSIIRQYEEGDCRLSYWFYAPLKAAIDLPTLYCDYLTCKYYHNTKDSQHELGNEFAFRTGEVIVSLAEAYARKPQPEPYKAIQLLNELRRKRFTAASYQDLTAASFAPQALVEFVWSERRRELCFEELHRWWDLRRTTQPRLEHRWRNNTKYVLDEGDPAYVLNFPAAELSFNGAQLVPNVRPNRPELAQ